MGDPPERMPPCAGTETSEGRRALAPNIASNGHRIGSFRQTVNGLGGSIRLRHYAGPLNRIGLFLILLGLLAAIFAGVLIAMGAGWYIAFGFVTAFAFIALGTGLRTRAVRRYWGIR